VNYVFRQLIEDTELTVAVFRPWAVRKNPAKAKRDHAHSLISKLFLKRYRKTYQKRLVAPYRDAYGIGWNLAAEATQIRHC